MQPTTMAEKKVNIYRRWNTRTPESKHASIHPSAPPAGEGSHDTMRSYDLSKGQRSCFPDWMDDSCDYVSHIDVVRDARPT